MGVMKGDTRSLDYGSNNLSCKPQALCLQLLEKDFHNHPAHKFPCSGTSWTQTLQPYMSDRL